MPGAANRMYDEGLLHSAARQTLAHRIPRLFRSDAADITMLRNLTKRLICDRDVRTRDITAHALRRTSVSFCLGVYEAVKGSTEADEWTHACAVYTLGFWDSEREAISVESLRYAPELLIRRAADAALDVKRKHQHLQRHVQQFNETEGLSRLASYLCLKEQGSVSTLRTLLDDTPERSPTKTHIRHLANEMTERLGKEYRKRQEQDEKLDQSRGMIWFF